MPEPLPLQVLLPPVSVPLVLASVLPLLALVSVLPPVPVLALVPVQALVPAPVLPVRQMTSFRVQ